MQHYYPCYKISKCALNMYTRTLASRLNEDKITVSSVHPGWVRTEMGGEDADMSPEEAAAHIYELAIKPPKESGQFWFKGEKMSW
jgi:NAD(P)-dependent dehydrogenase (short-subunit alcohol dehydrogenase family)